MIVTGAIGIGKTTVCRKVIGLAARRGRTCGGIVTYKAKDGSIIIEDVQAGESATLASTEPAFQGPRAGKYYFSSDGIDFGRAALNRGSWSDVLVIDEIGPLELAGEGFVNALELIRSRRFATSIAVIRSQLLPAFLPRLGGTKAIFETSVDNRDGLPEEIAGEMAR